MCVYSLSGCMFTETQWGMGCWYNKHQGAAKGQRLCIHMFFIMSGQSALPPSHCQTDTFLAISFYLVPVNYMLLQRFLCRSILASINMSIWGRKRTEDWFAFCPCVGQRFTDVCCSHMGHMGEESLFFLSREKLSLGTDIVFELAYGTKQTLEWTEELEGHVYVQWEDGRFPHTHKKNSTGSRL